MQAGTYHFKTPGLYLKGLETETSPAILSAVTGFVGITERGPVNMPQPVKNWGEFIEIFGGFVPYGYLPQSVFGFFLNGGERCYIVRVGRIDESGTTGENEECECVNPLKKASIKIKIGEDCAVGVEAIDPGSWGNRVNVIVKVKEVESVEKVRFEFIYKERKEIFADLSLDPEKANYFVDTINGPEGLDDNVQRHKAGCSTLVKVRHITDAAEISSLPGGDGIAYLEGGGDGFIDAVGTLSDENENPFMQIVSKKKGKAGNEILVSAEPFTTKTALKIDDEARNRLVVEDIECFYVKSPPNGSAGGGEWVFDNTLIDMEITLRSEDGLIVEQAIIEGPDESIENHGMILKKEHALMLSGDVSGDFPVGSEIMIPGRFNIIVTKEPDKEPVDTFYNLSMEEQSERYFKKIINRDSEYICVSPGEGENTGIPVGEIRLSGGKDPGRIDYRYYTGYEEIKTGKYFISPSAGPGRLLGAAALENIPDVSLIAVPDLSRMKHKDEKAVQQDFQSAQEGILFHCSKMGERFAVLDSLFAVDSDHPHSFEAKEAKFGALYYPWVYCTTGGVKELVPPSGFIAGVMAQTDRLYGVDKAPANMKIKGVVDLGTPPIIDRTLHGELIIDRTLQDKLNPAGINCIRKFEDGDIKVWGSRTLSMETKWRFVNVRRIFLNIIKTLSKELLWTVFENNNSTLWMQIESTITSFFETMAAKGMTAGTTAGDAFYVRCNEETNPKEVGDAGQVVAEVGVALSAPAEFIVITVKQTPESLSIFEEDT